MGIEIVRRNALQALLPPPNVPLADWIESSVYIPASASALPGRMQLWPFQRGWCEAIEDPEIERITILKGARIGYTQWLSATLAHFVANMPAPIIALQPTADDARDFSVELEALFEASPALRGLLSDDADESGRSTMLARRFPGGSLKFLAAKSPRNLRRHTTRFLAMDEIDGYEVTQEGDPIKLAEMRTLKVDAIRAAAREALTQRSAPKITVRRDNIDPAAIQTRAADALSYRMGGLAELPEASREYAHMSLMEHARDALARAGVSTRGMSPDEVLHRSLTTSDFPLVVANAANKTAADGYKAAESGLKPLFRQRSLSDFKTATSVRLGGMGMLAEMTESGEFTAVSRGEEGEALQLRTFGRRLDLSRRLIINDDLALFGDTTRALGEAAAQTEAALMADLLTGSDALSDGTALFHASRGNIVDVAAAAGDLAAQPLLWALSQARLTMRQQKNLDGSTPIAATPKFIVAGPEMETRLEQILTPVNNVAQADANVFVGKLSLLIDPRIEGDDWFVFADPAQAHVFNIAHLAAAPGPQIQRQEAWDTLGVSFRCWMDTGVGFAGWRGAVKVLNG